MKKSIIMLLPLVLFAGTAGKIRERVIDVETKAPLVGVDVFIPQLGDGATDPAGYYFILNIPPGNYDVETSIIGYRPEIIREVNVSADRTHIYIMN